MTGRVGFEMGLGSGPGLARRKATGGLTRLLLIGDFSAASERPRLPLAARRPLRLDIDSLDRAMARLAPRLQLPQGEMQFDSLDDFHPDRLFERLPLFQGLREARARPVAESGDLLGQLLGGKASAAAATAPATGIEALIRQVVAPHIVPDTTAQTRSYQAAVDLALGEEMRRLLHAPAFQALEAAWRGAQWLISRLELDEGGLELHLFDARRDELLADLIGAQGRVSETGLHQALVEESAESWSLLAGLYRFGPGTADQGLLAALGLLAKDAGAPFVAEGDPALADDAGPAWRQLRKSEAAPWIGLAAPRLLLRQPYGRRRDPVEQFAFEEIEGAPVHEDLLWGSAALAPALLVGRAASAGQEPEAEREIEDLPAVHFDQGGEPELQACAEFFLGEPRGLQMLAAGLMPLMSHRHRNAVTLMRLQSVAEPACALAGRL